MASIAMEAAARAEVVILTDMSSSCSSSSSSSAGVSSTGLMSGRATPASQAQAEKVAPSIASGSALMSSPAVPTVYRWQKKAGGLVKS